MGEAEALPPGDCVAVGVPESEGDMLAVGVGEAEALPERPAVLDREPELLSLGEAEEEPEAPAAKEAELPRLLLPQLLPLTVELALLLPHRLPEAVVLREPLELPHRVGD